MKEEQVILEEALSIEELEERVEFGPVMDGNAIHHDMSVHPADSHTPICTC